MMNNFYDTSSLLLAGDEIFSEKSHIILSSITLKELEKIKTSIHKDLDVKYSARKLLHYLNENPNSFTCWIFTDGMESPILNAHLELTDDTRILASAINYASTLHDEEFNFYTNDLSLKHLASLFFNTQQLKSIKEEPDSYLGYKNIKMTEEEMSNFYTSLYDGSYNNKIHLLPNEYINILSDNEQIVDTYRWTGYKFEKIKYTILDSSWLGKIKPYQGDIYQAMVVDSFLNNKITMIKGPAGSGKSYLSMAYLFNCLDKGKIDKIIIFCNPVATKNSAKLGFYPGSRDEKLLDSQIGNFLTSKLGGRIAVEQLINEEKLILLPFSDIRGYDTSGMNAGIYITEAQNLDISLLKLALQRIGEDSICIVEGDEKTQVDLVDYEGFNNGMRRMSKVFRGHDIYGEITLQKIHRSKIAEIAEKL